VTASKPWQAASDPVQLGAVLHVVNFFSTKANYQSVQTAATIVLANTVPKPTMLPLNSTNGRNAPFEAGNVVTKALVGFGVPEMVTVAAAGFGVGEEEEESAELDEERMENRSEVENIVPIVELRKRTK